MSDNRKPFNPIPIPIRDAVPIQQPTQTVVVLSADVIRQALGVNQPEVKPVLLNSSRCPECSARGWKKCHHRYLKCLDCQKATKIYVCFIGDVKRCGKYGQSTHTHVGCECRELTFEGKVEFKTRKDQFTPRSDQGQTVTEAINAEANKGEGE